MEKVIFLKEKIHFFEKNLKQTSPKSIVEKEFFDNFIVIYIVFGFVDFY